MADQKAQRVDVGFQGGQVLSVRVLEEDFAKLRNVLTEGGEERWHELRTQDSDISLDLAQVVYLRVETEEHRVGF